MVVCIFTIQNLLNHQCSDGGIVLLIVFILPTNNSPKVSILNGMMKNLLRWN